MKRSISIIANSGADSNNMSGGDRFFIEYARAWSRYAHVNILTCIELAEVCRKENLDCPIISLSRISVEKSGLYVAYAVRMLKPFFVRPNLSHEEILFSSSDFLPDVIPASLYKFARQRRLWVAALHLLAPNPFANETRCNVRAFFYYLSQRIAILIMKCFADHICVVNQSDADTLVYKHRIAESKVVIIRPGVLTPPSLSSNEFDYEACFIGRFHEQKGIPELLRIWKRVCSSKRNAKLAIIGRGNPEWHILISNFLKENRLEDNVVMLGFLDGDDKFQILQRSRVFLFPSNYESFGIVGLEALACGTPVVAFELDVFKAIFGEVFSMVPLGDVNAFADRVVGLLSDDELHLKKRHLGLEFSRSYGWDQSAKQLFDRVTAKDK